MAFHSADNTTSAGSGSWIQLPVRLFLTDIGEEGLQEKSRVTRIPDTEGNEAPTISGERVLASSLKSLIIDSRVNQIELTRTELISKRHEITDITKLIVYSLLYRLFPFNLIKLLDRKGIKILEEDPLADQAWVKEKRELQHALRREVFGLAKRIQTNENLLAEREPVYRKKSIASITIKLIDMIPVHVWRTMAECKKERIKISSCILALISKYVDRSKFSDYFSLTFLEWIQKAEQANLRQAFTLWSQQHEDRTGQPAPYASLEQALREDREFHSTLTELAAENKIQLKINWKFGRSQHKEKAVSFAVNDLAIIRLRLFHKGLLEPQAKKNIETRIYADTREKHLGDFWQAPKEEGQLGSDLGLVYTAYLKRACHHEGIDVFFRIGEDKTEDETITNLTMRINPLGFS